MEKETTWYRQQVCERVIELQTTLRYVSVDEATREAAIAELAATLDAIMLWGSDAAARGIAEALQEIREVEG